ncbi:MAG: hypothetical protein EOP51_09160 [Sphingobacteriales bacterium]|nr:MAG: hypothetical protein EOP51_09160 [Sphingobacteriales bacterium]
MDGLMFTAQDSHDGLLTTYSVYCSEDAEHKVHCEGAIYNLRKDEEGNYIFADNDVPAWLKAKENQITLKLQDGPVK